MKCKVCGNEAVVALKSHNAAFCEKCYPEFFRRQLRRGIESRKLFTRDDKILVAISGGKDSLTLILELWEMGYNVTGLFVDLAIPQSSAVARAISEDFCYSRGIPLVVLDLAAEGLAIPRVKKYLNRPVCSTCGKIKRHFFNRAALAGGYDVLATGHNLDDEVARLFSNTLRWDSAYLSDQGPLLPAASGFARKVKPLWRLSEFETANYAFLRGFAYHHATCPYSPGASFSTLKGILNRLERAMPGRKLDFYQGFLDRGKQAFSPQAQKDAELFQCRQCGFPTSSMDLCGVCRIKAAIAQKDS